MSTSTRIGSTIASAGYDDQGVGSEVVMGDGVIGVAAQRVGPEVVLGRVREAMRLLKRGRTPK